MYKQLFLYTTTTIDYTQKTHNLEKETKLFLQKKNIQVPLKNKLIN